MDNSDDIAASEKPNDKRSKVELQTETRPLRIRVGDLLQGQREAILDHDGQNYRLRITASGKLILTK